MSGNAQVIFTTPEVLLTDKNWVDVFQSPSLHQRLVGIIIDEAHLVKKWYVLIGVISFIEYTIFYVGAVISQKNFPSWVICVDFFLPNSGSSSASMRKDVIKVLGMHKPVLILRCPNNTNIIYELREKSAEVEDELQYLVDEVIKFHTKTAKTIIFCRTYNDCSRIYQLFKLKLRKEMTDPVGYPDISPFRLVDMFHANNC